MLTRSVQDKSQINQLILFKTFIVFVTTFLEDNISKYETLNSKVQELQENTLNLKNQIKKLNEKKIKMDIQ